MFIKKVLYVSVILLLFISYLTYAQTVTKVLQNGKDDYEGCVDSYTYSFNPDDNFSTEDELFNHNCQN